MKIEKLPDNLEKLMVNLSKDCPNLKKIRDRIKEKLEKYADGKQLKGDEIVGWLGEIYGKLLLKGTLVSDKNEHDFEAGVRRIAVKSRKGWNSQWTQTSAISKIEGNGCPTHLMFLHFDDDYSLQRVWLYPWDEIRDAQRFKVHKSRGQRRSYIFKVKPKKDDNYILWEK